MISTTNKTDMLDTNICSFIMREQPEAVIRAIAAGVILVTNNTREFERVPGLVLEDWVN
ncbi:type II toxin-antitoxin system VapC family toxin [Erwinia billingiae]|jgi:tRNA(fMet)-specific endonuclease VapC|uniref:type II toxin-antitoxin system VapC family toxin n=1 Tax=Erwinia billingiae TaxID=182337 RepID=UPI0011B08048|nr:type II toxin-antitoxin system VapC family toxin [Erwinia billingiae]